MREMQRCVKINRSHTHIYYIYTERERERERETEIKYDQALYGLCIYQLSHSKSFSSQFLPMGLIRHHPTPGLPNCEGKKGNC